MALPLVRKFFGKTIGDTAAFAGGAAIARTLHPGLQALTNETWAKFPEVPLDPATAAQVVAEDVEQLAWGAAEAAQHGVDGDRFGALLGEVLNAPGLPQLFEAWRRDLIDDQAFEHGLRKAKLETRWDAPLRALKRQLLSLSDLANARQQGFVDEARQVADSGHLGLDADDAQVLFELAGLPLGVETMQQALNRGLVDRAAFDQAIREGHTKTKYTDLARALANPLLSADEYATLHLKGWIDEAAMHAGGALHGFTPAQMDQKYLEKGRPISPTQAYTAWAREAPGPYGGTFDEADFTKAIAQSDIRPEYAPVLWHNRFNYPSLFQMRQLVSSGAIDRATALDILHKERYPDELATKMVGGWLKGAGGSAKAETATAVLTEYEGRFVTRSDALSALEQLGYAADVAEHELHLADARRVKKYRDAALSRIHAVYVAHKIDEATAAADVDRLGVVPPARDLLLELWAFERDVNVSVLTPAQIKRAFVKGVKDRAWALAELDDRNYSTEDANTLLDE